MSQPNEFTKPGDHASPGDHTSSGRDVRAKSHEAEPSGNMAKSAIPGEAKDAPHEPDWTRGLKRLYDSVLEEPVPDIFKDLLSKLDNKSSR